MGYQSVVLECEAFLDVDDTQKMKIFEMILDKYCVGYKSEGLEYAHKEFNNVTAIRLKIINATGKEEAVKDD